MEGTAPTSGDTEKIGASNAPETPASPTPNANATVFITLGLIPITAAACLSWLTARSALPIQVLFMKSITPPSNIRETTQAKTRSALIEITEPIRIDPSKNEGGECGYGPKAASARLTRKNENPNVTSTAYSAGRSILSWCIGRKKRISKTTPMAAANNPAMGMMNTGWIPVTCCKIR